MRRILEKLLAGEHLTMSESKEFMEEIIRGNIPPHQVTAFMVALKVIGESTEEIIGLVQAMRSHMKVPFKVTGSLLDTCGTGGDGGGTINISTAAAFVAAAAGVPVAKHGNRAISSKSGSADVLEAIGLPLELTADTLEELLSKENLAFFYAPIYHPGMKNAGQSRKELGVRTVFNILGPLCNPLEADHQVIGVYDSALTEPIANVLLGLGVKRALVVAGLDGLDEITTTTTTKITELREQQITTSYISPQDLGLFSADPSDLQGGTPEENAQDILEIFQGKKGAKRDIILANAGAGLYVFGKAGTLVEGVKFAEEIVDSGKVYEKIINIRRLVREKETTI